MATKTQGVGLFPLKAGQKLTRLDLVVVFTVVEVLNLIEKAENKRKKPKKAPKIVEKTSKLKYFKKMVPETAF